MGEQKEKGSDLKRRALQVLSILGGLAALVLPALFAFKSIGKTSAMLAFSLIFLNVITGSAGLPFYRIFKAKHVIYVHTAAGVSGFALAVLHMFGILSAVNIWGYNAAWVLGPVALALLAVTITVAIWRKRIGSIWRRIHQINYVIFVLILIKVFIIGSNTRTMNSLTVIFAVFGALAAVGLAYRIKRYLDLRKRRAPRGDS